MDFSANIGTPVYATGNGVVTKAGWQSGYGKIIKIDHGYGYETGTPTSTIWMFVSVRR